MNLKNHIPNLAINLIFLIKMNISFFAWLKIRQKNNKYFNFLINWHMNLFMQNLNRAAKVYQLRQQ